MEWTIDKSREHNESSAPLFASFSDFSANPIYRATFSFAFGFLAPLWFQFRFERTKVQRPLSEYIECTIVVECTKASKCTKVRSYKYTVYCALNGLCAPFPLNEHCTPYKICGIWTKRKWHRKWQRKIERETENGADNRKWRWAFFFVFADETNLQFSDTAANNIHDANSFGCLISFKHCWKYRKKIFTMFF